jgi:hypothetical protein
MSSEPAPETAASSNAIVRAATPMEGSTGRCKEDPIDLTCLEDSESGEESADEHGDEDEEADHDNGGNTHKAATNPGDINHDCGRDVSNNQHKRKLEDASSVMYQEGKRDSPVAEPIQRGEDVQSGNPAKIARAQAAVDCKYVLLAAMPDEKTKDDKESHQLAGGPNVPAMRKGGKVTVDGTAKPNDLELEEDSSSMMNQAEPAKAEDIEAYPSAEERKEPPIVERSIQNEEQEAPCEKTTVHQMENEGAITIRANQEPNTREPYTLHGPNSDEAANEEKGKDVSGIKSSVIVTECEIIDGGEESSLESPDCTRGDVVDSSIERKGTIADATDDETKEFALSEGVESETSCHWKRVMVVFFAFILHFVVFKFVLNSGDVRFNSPNLGGRELSRIHLKSG